MMDTKPLQHTPEFEALCEDAKTRIHEISAEDVRAMINSGDDFCLIDVRDPDEYAVCCIGNAAPLSKGWLEAKIHTVVPDKSRKIVLYCGSGNRSALAADSLQRMGYSNILSMAGGIKGWINKGFEVFEN